MLRHCPWELAQLTLPHDLVSTGAASRHYRGRRRGRNVASDTPSCRRAPGSERMGRFGHEPGTPSYRARPSDRRVFRTGRRPLVRAGTAGRQERRGSWRETAHGALAETALPRPFVTGGPHLEPYLPHPAVPSLAGASHEPITHGPHQPNAPRPSRTSVDRTKIRSVEGDTERVRQRRKPAHPHDCRTPDRLRSIATEGLA